MKRLVFISLWIAIPLLYFLVPAIYAQDEVVRTPDEILSETGDISTPEAIRELFINCSSWDEEHAGVETASKDKLIELGALAVPVLLEYLPSENVEKRVTLDDIIRAIGPPACQYLIQYLNDVEAYTRQHAAYLIGDTAAANLLESPAQLGPVPEDVPAIRSLRNAMDIETDWHVKRALIESLGKMRDPSQIQTIAIYLENEEQALRLSAVNSLCDIPDQAAVIEIIRAFGDPVMNVRQAAVAALSTITIGNLGFELLVGTMGLSPAGLTGQQCAVESLSGFLGAIASRDDTRSDGQRRRAYDAALYVLDAERSANVWSLRGFAYELTGYTYHPNAAEFLSGRLVSEKHPFARCKILKALERLEAGRPVTPE